MKNKLFLGVAILTLGSLGFAKPYSIDPAHSSVGFEVKHLGFSKVNGVFDQFSGKIDIDPKTKKINVLEGNIKIASIDTKNQKREDHLKADDFFNATKFPEGKFVMTKQDGNKIYGNLTLKGITKPVIWNIEVNGPGTNPMTKKEFMALEINGSVSRKDFKIGTGMGDVVLGDIVNVKIQLEVYAQ